MCSHGTVSSGTSGTYKNSRQYFWIVRCEELAQILYIAPQAPDLHQPNARHVDKDQHLGDRPLLVWPFWNGGAQGHDESCQMFVDGRCTNHLYRDFVRNIELRLQRFHVGRGLLISGHGL